MRYKTWAFAAIFTTSATMALGTTVLYTQNFESPTGFHNDGADVNIFRTINQNYGNQPAGFQFAQTNTVETLLLTGHEAFGIGYSDPAHIGGNYSIGMLSTFQDDRLGLSFNVGSKKYLNCQLDVSSIDLSSWSGPFVHPGDVPSFRFTLYDNPGGAVTIGSGKVLATGEGSGVAAPNRTTLDWTLLTIPLDASDSTNGNVTVQIDEPTGGYATLDNFRIAASDTPGDVGTVTPEPASYVLVLAGLVLLYSWRRSVVGKTFLRD